MLLFEMTDSNVLVEREIKKHHRKLPANSQKFQNTATNDVKQISSNGVIMSKIQSQLASK